MADTDDYIKALLDLNAQNFLAEDFPALYALVKSEVEAGRANEDILKRCAKIDEVADTILNSIEMAIDYLPIKRGK